MKTINLKALVLSVALPLLGSFLFVACGGDGGSPTQLNNQNLPAEGAYELVYPEAGSTVCTYPQFKIHFKDKDQCYARDLSDTIGLIPQGQNTSVGVTIALQSVTTADGGCDFTFYPKAALSTSATVQWGVFQGTSSGSSLRPQFKSFLTSEAAACPGDGARFVMSAPLTPGVYKAVGDVGTLGTLNPDGSFNSNFNADAAFQLLAANSAYIFAVSLVGTPIGAYDKITLRFNEAPMAESLQGSIQVSAVNYSSLSFDHVQLKSGTQGVHISATNPNWVVIEPPAEGWSENTFSVAINKSVLSQSGRPLMAEGLNGPSSYVFIFKSYGSGV